VFSITGYLCDNTLAIDMGYPTKGGFASVGCPGIAAFGEGGQGLFFPGVWVAV